MPLVVLRDVAPNSRRAFCIHDARCLRVDRRATCEQHRDSGECRATTAAQRTIDPSGFQAKGEPRKPKNSEDLTWDEFKGKPDNSDSDAATYAGFDVRGGKASWKTTKGDDGCWTATISISGREPIAKFDAQKSWVRKRTPELLEHERLHLRIAEVFAKMLADAANKLTSTMKSCKSENDAKKAAWDDLNAQYAALYARLWKEFEERNDIYDKETDHGRNPEKQDEWKRKLGGMPR